MSSDSLEFIKEISNKFKPKCFLHNKEKYFPSTIQDYLEKVQMFRLKSGSENTSKDDQPTNIKLFETSAGIDNTVSSTSVSNINQIELTSGETKNTDYFKPIGYDYKNIANKELTDLVNNEWRSTFYGNAYLNKTPYYILYHKDKDDSNVKHISYSFFYSFNGPAKLLFDLIKIEDHFCDCEHITVTVEPINKNNNLNDINNYKIKQVYYAAHSGGTIIFPDKLKTIDNNSFNPIVYTALGSHASYIDTGIYFRISGFGNDITEEGFEWFPEIEIVSNEGEGVGEYKRFYSYKGNLGFKGGLPLSGEYNYGDTSVGSLGTKGWSGNNGTYEIEEREGINLSNNLYHTLLIIYQLIFLFAIAYGYYNDYFHGYNYIFLAVFILLVFYIVLLFKYKFQQFILLILIFLLLLYLLRLRKIGYL